MTYQPNGLYSMHGWTFAFDERTKYDSVYFCLSLPPSLQTDNGPGCWKHKHNQHVITFVVLISETYLPVMLLSLFLCALFISTSFFPFSYFALSSFQYRFFLSYSSCLKMLKRYQLFSGKLCGHFIIEAPKDPSKYYITLDMSTLFSLSLMLLAYRALHRPLGVLTFW